MTKQVRVENADTSDHKMVVQTYQGTPDNPGPMIAEKELNNPAEMGDFLIHDQQFLIVKEV